MQITIKFKELIFFSLGIISVVAPLLYFFDRNSIIGMFIISARHGDNLSNNATNLGLLMKTFLYKDNITPYYWLKLSKYIFYFISFIFLFKIAIKKKTMDSLYLAGTGILFAYYIFFTGAHENHLFPATVLSLGLIINKSTRRNMIIFLTISLISFLNLIIYYGLGTRLINESFESILSRITFLPPIVSILSLVYFLIYFYKYLKNN